MSSSYPRLNKHHAKIILNDFLKSYPIGNEFEPNLSRMPEHVKYASVSLENVDAYFLHQYREGAVQTASKFGFPDVMLETGNKSEFDDAMTIWIGESGLFKSREFLDDEVWTAMSLIIWPDIIYWRFGETPQRYVGGRRNAFQRLWARSRVFDRGELSNDRWRLIIAMNEDELVQIMERPALGQNPRIARLFAEAALMVGVNMTATQRKEAIRRATKIVRAQKLNRDFSMHTDSDLIGLFGSYFH